MSNEPLVNLISINLALSSWDVVCQSLDLAVKQGGIKNAFLVLPVFKEIEAQLRAIPGVIVDEPTKPVVPTEVPTPTAP